MAHRFYSCHLLGDGHPSSATMDLNCTDDAAAILAGRVLAEAQPGCTGYEIRRGVAVVYRLEWPRVSATVIDIHSRQSSQWARASARVKSPATVDPSVIEP